MEIEITDVMITDTDKLLITEDVLEKYLVNINYPGILDGNRFIDSNITCDYAWTVGMMNLGDFDGYLFAGDEYSVFSKDRQLLEFLKKNYRYKQPEQ